MSKLTRWGFMGTGKIASDFATAMQVLPKEEHQLVAVSASNLKRAKEFAEKFGAKHAFDTYEKIANCPDVDVIYINVINPQHIHCVKLALNAGKAVLCEKPVGLNIKQTQEMVNLARQKGVFFMEAFWSRCFPVFHEIRAAIKSGRIGEPKIVQINFGIKPDPVKAARLFDKSLGGSALLDIGCYMLTFSTMIFNGQRPLTVQASGNLNADQVDTEVCMVLKYPNGTFAQLTCSTQLDLDNRAFVYGSSGRLEVPNPFYCPTVLLLNKGKEKIEHPLPENNGHFNYPGSAGLAYEAQHVGECLNKGLKESPLMPLDDSLAIVSIMDEVRRQLGVVYEEDLQ